MKNLNQGWTTVGDMQIQILGEGETIIFCHGFTTTGEFWRNQAAEFSKKYRVVILNLPGHGISPAPQHREYSIKSFSEDLGLIYEQLGIKEAILVGLSMGGTIAQHFVLNNQEKVKALILVGATPHGLGPDVKADSVIENIKNIGIQKASQQVIERSFTKDAPKDLISFAKKEVIQTPEHVAIEAIKSLNESDSRKMLHQIQVPTLVICGIEDEITPTKESQYLAENIPDAKLKLVEGAAHFPMLEKPKEFNDSVIQFLQEI